MKLTMQLAIWLLAIVFLASVDNALARRSGGTGGGRKSSSGIGSWFGGSSSKTSSSNRNPQSSYPKQTWSPSNTGTNTGTNTGSFGGNKQGGSNIGGGGFVNPSGNRGGYSGGGYSGGGYSGGGYSGGYSNPNIGRSQGYYGAGGQSIFGSSRSNYNYQRSPFGGFSGSKGLAIGAGAGFIGGAVAGVAAVSMYHQYRQYQSLLYCHANPMCYGTGYGGYGYGYGGRRILVNAQDCVGGCPNQAYCDYAVCRCRDGYEARYGSCFKTIEDFSTRQSEWDSRTNKNYNPYHGCSQHKDCHDVDMNMVCKSDKCACRENMKWNDEVHECQIFVDVDCSDVDVKSSVNNGPVASALTDSANVTLGGSETEYHEHNGTLEYDDEEHHHNGTDGEHDEDSVFNNLVNVTSLTPNVTLADSELTKINPNTTSEKEIKAAFCREIAKTARVYAPPPARVPVNRNSEGTPTWVTVLIIVIFLALVGCCCAGIYKKCKRGPRRPKDYSEDDNAGMNQQPNMMAFSTMQQEPPPYTNTDQGGYPQVPIPYPPGPEYPQGPGAYAPYPQGPGEAAPYPPGPGAPYPPGPGAPYPPGPGAPYPPGGAAPYPPAPGGAPYPPGPYNPAAPYPPQGAPYPPQGPY